RFEVEGQRRHAIAAATRPGFDALVPDQRGFERFQLARFYLRQRAKPAIHIEALRLVTPLQFKPRPRLRLVERAQFLGKAVFPAFVAMLVELAADRIEPGYPRQDSDQTGSAPPAPLVLNTLLFRVVSCSQRLPFAALAC